MNKIITFTATVKYAQVFERNRDMGGDDNEAAQSIARKGGQYKITCYPDDPNELIQKCTEAGVHLHPMGHDLFKKNEEGTFIVLKRAHNCPVDKDGNPIDNLGGPPKVVDSDNNKWDDEINIGNGSKCEVAFDAWGNPGKLWTKLRAIKVLELVEYNSEEVDPSIAWALT